MSISLKSGSSCDDIAALELGREVSTGRSCEKGSMHIDPRFNGPSGSANGGYTCGALAHECSLKRAEVTLRKPPPLGKELSLREGQLLDDQTLIAEIKEATLQLEVPTPPTLVEAKRAGLHYSGQDGHPFPTCFVCGPGRPDRDGLGLFAGAVEGHDMVATMWTPPLELADSEGMVREEFLWCALDCPGAWSLDQKMEHPMLLGRLTASIEGTLTAGRPAVVMGWPLGREGRKAFAGTAVVDENGRVVARARAVWIRL